MIRTGAQIRAARALLGIRREDLARPAGLHPNAVKYWEGRDVPPDRTPYAVTRIEWALNAMGADTFTDPRPGVCLSVRASFCGPLKGKRAPVSQKQILDPLKKDRRA
jgi:hypothetical protein